MSPVGCCDSLEKCHFLPRCHLRAALPPPFFVAVASDHLSGVTLSTPAASLWGWCVSHVMPACVPKVITGMTDEIRCPEAPKVSEKMALWIQRANLTERYSVGGDWLTG